MKVGKDPVVSPFNRCSVVVGGSAMNGSRNALSGVLLAVSYRIGKASWNCRGSSSGQSVGKGP